MDPRARIAVVGVADPTLLQILLALPSQPDARAFPSLYGDTEAIRELRPEVVFAAVSADTLDTMGSLRLLRTVLPDAGIVLVTAAAHELLLEPVGRRLGARLLVLPCRPGEVAAALEQALAGSDPPRAEVVADLVRGIADEINNPLMFLSGYLQLLRAGLDAARDRDQHDQLQSALAGVARIQSTIARVQLIARAEQGLRLDRRVDLAAATLAAVAALPAPVRPPIERGGRPDLPFLGDPELVHAALVAFARIAAEFVELGDAVTLQLEAVGGAARLRMRVHAHGLHAWRLPRTFDPYYLNRVFKGTSQGLGLFLVHTVLHAHRGEAMARRLGDDVLAIDLLVPLAAGV